MTKNVNGSTPSNVGRFSITAERSLFVVWLCMGLVPLVLQTRSYLQFVKPHKIPSNLVVPPGVEKETTNLTELCPMNGFLLAGVWWNIEATHYYTVPHGRICHTVAPQYNSHGNYIVGDSRVTPYRTTPSSCAGESYHYEQSFYHASIGYYTFYEQLNGTYCAKDNTAYIYAVRLGTFDSNGSALANDTGSDSYRKSIWYCTVGAIWIMYRVLLLRRSLIMCKRYGRRCDEMGEKLHQQDAVVFVQESLRLSAHGASNYHRIALLYFLVEGIMTDLFLIVANDGFATKIQYASLGYNLSGLLLMVFEMLESMHWLSEQWRLRIKRLVFSYESALVGELVGAGGLQNFLTSFNGSGLRQSRRTALAVSYYFWSLICHMMIVLVVMGTLITVRVIWSMVYIRWKHHSLAILSKPCCVDTAFGLRNRIVLLSGYRLEDGKLYYKMNTLRAFGVLKMEEGDAEFFVLHKLHWFTVPNDNLVGIGIVLDQRVEPCDERPCGGIISFFNKRLGGASNQGNCLRTSAKYRPAKVLAGSGRSDAIP